MTNKNQYSSFIKQSFFEGLDGLRGFSILAVVWHHTAANSTSIRSLNLGFLGVDLFFVISGFLIVTLLLREKRRNKFISLRDFYIRRSLRIFPLYYGYIIMLTTLYYIFNNDSEFGKGLIKDLPVYFLYLGNYIPVGMGIVWSLASEEQFYLIWPLIEKYFQNYIILLLIVFISVNQSINFFHSEIAAWIHHPELAELSILQTTFTPILLGVVLAHLLNKKATFNRINTIFSPSYSPLFFILALFFTISMSPDDISGFPRLTIQILMMLFVGSIVTNKSNCLLPILTFTPFKRTGVVSYGIYLSHIMVIAISKKILSITNLSSELLLFVISFILSFLVAELSFRYYESPFLKLKTRFHTAITNNSLNH